MTDQAPGGAAANGSGSGERGAVPGTRRYEKPGAASSSSSGKPGPGEGSSGSAKGVAEGGVRGLLARATPLDALIALILLALGVTFWLPSHWEATRRENEAAALGFTREVLQLQQTFKAQKGGGARFASGFFELAAAGIYQGEAPEGGTIVRGGYIFKITPLDSEPVRWYATAVPASYGTTGDHAYYVDDTGKVRVSNGPISGPAFEEAP